ncbi:hypothetical protein NPIL_466751 [Nephila pilipes]|uniref:Secreted protein n=1 Tax=Nephila pilipes TaxID=299642 RepID=A0A8X6QZE8_NEPPI|nr:hypothetical protein NPIL_466751 [Nephila pilipes]
MPIMQASFVFLLCTLVSWTLAIPKPSAGNFGSGGGEIPRDNGQPWDSPSFGSFDGPESELFDEYDAVPHRVPSENDFRETEFDEHPDKKSDERPFEPDNKLHPESEEEEHDEDEFDGESAEGDVENPAEEDSEAGESHKGEEKGSTPESLFPLNPAIFSLKQVNHYFKELEKS